MCEQRYPHVPGGSHFDAVTELTLANPDGAGLI
jgi:hypothetical protein